MIHLLDLLCGWLFIAGEFESLPQRYAGNSQSALGVFLHETDRFIIVFIKHELLFARDSQKRKHVTTGERGHKCLLRIHKAWITQVGGSGRGLHLVSAVNFPGVITRIFLVFERLIAAFPSETDLMF